MEYRRSFLHSQYLTFTTLLRIMKRVARTKTTIMTFHSANGFAITIEEADDLGSVWTVRVFKRRLLFRTRISSDWFLDHTQAEKYARQIADELAKNTDGGNLLRRAPGWTLRRPRH